MESTNSSVFVAKAIKWAMHCKKQVDMFIVISHNQAKTVGAHPALRTYQTEMKSPNTKYVFCCLLYMLNILSFLTNNTVELQHTMYHRVYSIYQITHTHTYIYNIL